MKKSKKKGESKELANVEPLAVHAEVVENEPTSASTKMAEFKETTQSISVDEIAKKDANGSLRIFRCTNLLKGPVQFIIPAHWESSKERGHIDLTIPMGGYVDVAEQLVPYLKKHSDLVSLRQLTKQEVDSIKGY